MKFTRSDFPDGLYQFAMRRSRECSRDLPLLITTNSMLNPNRYYKRRGGPGIYLSADFDFDTLERKPKASYHTLNTALERPS